MKERGTVDAARDSYDEAARKSRRLVDAGTIKHRDCPEVGAENVCPQAIRELRLDTFLRREGFTTRLCSDASDSTAEIYRQIGYDPVPFRRRVTTETPPPPKLKNL